MSCRQNQVIAQMELFKTSGTTPRRARAARADEKARVAPRALGVKLTKITDEQADTSASSLRTLPPATTVDRNAGGEMVLADHRCQR